MNSIFKNWKTTVFGLVIAGLTVFRLTGKINQETFDLIVGLFASLGFIVAKDGSTNPREI